MKPVTYTKALALKTLRKERLESEGGSFRLRWIEESRAFDVTLTIDIEELLQILGRKAARNGSRKSRAFHGALVVKAKEIRT